jgi:hypothetical protein
VHTPPTASVCVRTPTGQRRVSVLQRRQRGRYVTSSAGFETIASANAVKVAASK